MNYQENAESQVELYFRLKPSARKFDSAENRELVAERVTSYGIIPSEVGVLRAIQELAAEDAIDRTDGRDEALDRLAAAKQERNRIDQIASAPSTPEEYERFARMSEADIERLFWSDSVFQARYRKASERWGFRLPGKPAPVADASTEPDLGEWKSLDAKTYHSIPTSRIIHLYRSSHQFKKAVDKLIAQGEI